MSRKLIILITSDKERYTCESKRLHDVDFLYTLTYLKTPEHKPKDLLEWVIQSIEELIKLEKLSRLHLIIKDKWLNSVLSNSTTFHIPKRMSRVQVLDYRQKLQAILEENLVSWEIY
jgi:hypothetical protein